MTSIDPRRIAVVGDTGAEIMRRQTPAEKLAMIDALWRTARSLTLGQLREQHPKWGDEQVRREIARRLSHGSV